MTTPDTGLLLSDDLNAAERELLHAAAKGSLVDLQAGGPKLGEPAQGAAWGPERTVRAQVLAELLTGQRTSAHTPLRAVKLRGARITGVLDLEATELVCPLLLTDCHFEEPVNFREATSPAIRLPGCHMPGLTAEQLHITGNMELNHGFAAAGQVSLTGGRIGGTLDLSNASLVSPGRIALNAAGLTVDHDLIGLDLSVDGGVNLEAARIGGGLYLDSAHLTNPGAIALQGDSLTVGRSMSCRDGFTAEGEIRLAGAHIGGMLDVGGAVAINPGGYSLWAPNLSVAQEMTCEKFTSVGEIRLQGARIGSGLSFLAATLTNPNGFVLRASSLIVAQSILFCGGFTATGEIRIPGARIGGVLSMTGATLTNADGRALDADGIAVEQSMLCDGGFAARGEVCLSSANITRLSFSGAELASPGGCALRADGATVTGDLDCRGGLIAEGEVHLIGAHIGGTLFLDGAKLNNPGGLALTADRLTVDQLTQCRDGFVVQGRVSLAGAHLGHLNLAGATLNNPGGQALFADRLTVDLDMYCWKSFTANGEVRLPGARIGGFLSFRQARLTNPGGVAVDLEAATAQTLTLLPRQPPDGIVDLTNAMVDAFRDDEATWPATLRLRGFTYDSLENDSIPVRTRLRWLTRDPGRYIPQIYDQLAAAYRRAGHEDAARHVAIAKHRRRRSVLGPAGKLLNWLLYVTVGYGYRTWLAAAWLAGFLIAGIAVFSHVQMTATVAHPGAFHPVGYTIDLLVPFADLGLKNNWQPSGSYLYLAWMLRGIGWILTTAVVAVLTGVIKRD